MFNHQTSASSSAPSSFFKRLLHRQLSFILPDTEDQQQEDYESAYSITSSKSDSTQWYYCDLCKIGFASKSRHHWHTNLCNTKHNN
jgi:hypothetical protein